MRRSALAVLGLAALAAVALAGWAGTGAADRASASAAAPACPKAWRAGWLKLADRVGAPVYCPSWMPDPLDGKIDGQYRNVASVDKRDRSYLISLLWIESDVGGISNEVHLNFRGYPSRTQIPTCRGIDLKAGKKVTRKVPCFSDRHGTVRAAGIEATVYTVNQDIDQWHVLYAWRHEGSLYTVSEHVAPPYRFSEVVRNLNRILRSLELIRPRS